MKRVREIMTRDITSVTPDDTMRDLAHILASQRLNGVPVVDANQKVVGFICEKDLLRAEFPEVGKYSQFFTIGSVTKLALSLINVGNRKVKDFMTTPAITVDEDSRLKDIIFLIIERGLKVIPVIKDGVLMGVVGRAEVCLELIESGEF